MDSPPLPVLGAELYLNKLEHTSEEAAVASSKETSGLPMKWQNERDTILIPPGGLKTVNIVELFGPSDETTPDQLPSDGTPKLKIGDYDVKEKGKGTWYATFSMYAENHKAVTFVVKITWSGNWTSRLAEMKDHFIITFE